MGTGVSNGPTAQRFLTIEMIDDAFFPDPRQPAASIADVRHSGSMMVWRVGLDSVQAGGGTAGELDGEHLAAGRGESEADAARVDRGIETIRLDEPGLIGQEAGRKVRANREVELITICGVVLPLGVAEEIPHRGLAFDDPEFTLPTDSRDIDAQACSGQDELLKTGKAQLLSEVVADTMGDLIACQS